MVLLWANVCMQPHLVQGQGHVLLLRLAGFVPVQRRHAHHLHAATILPRLPEGGLLQELGDIGAKEEKTDAVTMTSMKEAGGPEAEHMER
eukprot:CAMPEP_0115851050 /NCGR_PEP_ID=MMETSP0287-20121206/12278_1 /TAXON_ID=412157 /ORGANISM="Chrysochromulina rotalis, Strain UIO044" /LENGTH=89 /DNA_ID=CAMNT_0003305063 /DNA_START=174 /DNA_END=444 /DNA_ORIENTATION=+